jgi:hypothetical protein
MSVGETPLQRSVVPDSGPSRVAGGLPPCLPEAMRRPSAVRAPRAAGPVGPLPKDAWLLATSDSLANYMDRAMAAKRP